MGDDKKVEGKKIIFRKLVLSHFENKLPLHVMKLDGSWFNGYVVAIKEDYFVMNEFIYGEVIIFYPEIYKVETYRVKNPKDSGDYGKP